MFKGIIWKKYTYYLLIAFLTETYFIIPIWLFFYLQFITYQQIVVITVVQTLTALAFEIPTGAIADLFGRKASQIIGYILYTISLIVIVLSQTFIIFLIFEVVKGIAKAFLSGSFEAQTYDLLKENGDEQLYDEFVSTTEMLAWVALFISTIAGGFLYYINYQLPHWGVIVVYSCVTLLLIFKTKEPRLKEHMIDSSYKEFLKQNFRGFHELFANASIGLLVAFLALIALGYFFASELLGISQIEDYGLDGRVVGGIFAAGYLVAAAASYVYPQLKKVFSTTALLSVCTIILLSSLLFAKFVPLIMGLVLIFLRISSSTIFRNTRSVMLNRSISSRNRATALSSFNMLTLLPYAVISLLAGSYIDQQGANAFALLLGGGMVLLIVIIAILSLMLKTTTNDQA